MRRCPICNRPEDETRFFGEFCEDHAKKRMLDEINGRIKRIEIIKCKTCNRIKISGEYRENEEDTIKRIVDREVSPLRFSFSSYDKGKIIGIITKKTQEGALHAEVSLTADEKNVMCQDCYRKRSGYYEAVFQLRGNRERVEKISRKLDDFFTRREGFVSKVVEENNGIDVYVSSKLLSAKFIEIGKLKPTISYTLFTVKNNKKIYRNTYALHV